jgi:hypothetical protein
MRKFQTLGSALVLALTTALIAAPASARTHHPSTPQERAQTRDLNLQQLAIAQGQAPANQQAMNAAQTGQQAPAQAQQNTLPNQEQPAPPTNAPAPNAPSNGTPAPSAAPSDQSAPPAQQPAPSGTQ